MNDADFDLFLDDLITRRNEAVTPHSHTAAAPALELLTNQPPPDPNALQTFAGDLLTANAEHAQAVADLITQAGFTPPPAPQDPADLRDILKQVSL